MTRRRWQTDDYQPPPDDVKILPLFQGLGPGAQSGHAEELGQEGLARAVEQREGLLEQLTPIAQELATQAGPAGITVTDVRKAAYARGILTGHESRGALSALGALMRRAGLRATGDTRRSDLDSTHGIRQSVWVLPKYRGG